MHIHNLDIKKSGMYHAPNGKTYRKNLYFPIQQKNIT